MKDCGALRGVIHLILYEQLQLLLTGYYWEVPDVLATAEMKQTAE